ncbi:MAG: GFA family protein [Proteobacteria bacterium]|nr:GFA family protein [Pseudomonadota bacterium]
MFIHACHCRDCQIQVGGPFAINGIIEAEHVVQTKGPKPKRYPMPTESGRPHDIYRCPTCATALWSDYGRRKVMLFVRMTLLRPKKGFGGQALRLTNPDAHIFTKSKLPCDELMLLDEVLALKARGKKTKSQWSKDAPIAHTTVKGATTKKPAGVFSVYYDMQTEWPAASLKRREACLAAMKPKAG